MTNETTFIDNTKTNLRRTRQAYLGALGFGYDFAAARVEKRRDQIKSLFSDALAKGEDVKSETRDRFDRARGEVKDLADTSINEIEDRIDASKDAVQDLKEDIVETTNKVAERTAKVDTIEESDKYQSYLEKVRAYDTQADPIIIKKIVDHLGIALQSRDSMFVACSDEEERKTVAQNWLSKKLGVSGDAETLGKTVSSVCETMKGDRLKDRVTFYYLAAKAENKLSAI